MKRALLPLLLALPLYGATDYPPSLRWKTITTTHFFIHFHQGEEDLARRAAGYAEKAHERVVPMMGWKPHGRTNIVLTDHLDLANGSATTFPINLSVIYVTTPGADPTSSIDYYDNWLNLVITHEYTHILHLDQARGFSAFMRKVLGRNPLVAFPNEFSPLWMIEGLATLSESENTSTGRLKGTYVDMILRTAAIEHRWASESQASGLGPDWPTGGARYFYGSKFLSWLALTHGMDKLTGYVNEYSSNILPFRLNSTAKDVYGTSMKSLWRQWSNEQQAAYAADFERLTADGLTKPQRLTSLGYQTSYPTISPDGTRVAYMHGGPYERPTLRIRDLASGRDIATQSTNDVSPVSWSADGRSIAFADLEFAGSFALRSDLYVWDLDRGTRRVTQAARVKDPSFTPDGRTLVAVAMNAGRNRLVAVDATNGAVRDLVIPDDDRQFGQPVVSHDGRVIAVAEWNGGRVDIVLYDLDGRRLRNLTETLDHAINATPAFSPDDSTIWFSSDFTGISNLYAVPTRGGAIRRLTNVYGGALSPASINGSRFIYADYSSRGFDLASVDVDREYPIAARKIPTSMTGPGIAAAGGGGVPPEIAAATDYSPWRSLRPRWWYPIFTTQRINDRTLTELGAGTNGADVLGRHSYDASFTNRAFGVVYSYDRYYPTLTVAASRSYNDAVRITGSATNPTYTEKIDRVVGLATVRLRRVQWQLAGTGGLIRDRFGGSLPTGIVLGDLEKRNVFRGTLQGYRLGATFNNAHVYPFSISLERGIAASVDYESMSRSLGSDRDAQRLRGDLRGYLTIPYANSPLGRHVVAVRALGARNSGAFIFQRQIHVGGEGADEIITLDINNIPVRGFDSKTLVGSSAVAGSFEYRFPLYEVERGPSTIPFFFQRFHGALFADAARASGTRIASAGAEIAADFIIGNVLPIRYRLGVAKRLTDPDRGKVQPYFGLGSSF